MVAIHPKLRRALTGISGILVTPLVSVSERLEGQHLEGAAQSCRGDSGNVRLASEAGISMRSEVCSLNISRRYTDVVNWSVHDRCC
jgi:hypothetical protein